MSVNHYFGRRYDDEKYNCLHFTRDVWKDLTGEDLEEKLAGLLGPTRQVRPSHFKAFRRLAKPESPCIMYMTQLGRDPHVGVYLRGSILHIKSTGVEFLPPVLACRGATSVRYYK